jgi:hypothetical protein
MSVKTATVVRAEIETVEDLRDVIGACGVAWADRPFEIEKLAGLLTGLASGLVSIAKETETSTAAPVAEGSENHG